MTKVLGALQTVIASLMVCTLPTMGAVTQTPTGKERTAPWGWLNPLPQGNNMQGVACAGTSACYAVGSHGTILVSHHEDTAWKLLRSGITRDLDAVTCPDSSSCYAVGQFGTILVTHDAAVHWMVRRLSPADHLTRVSCPDDRTCYALGQDMTRICHVPTCNFHGRANVLVVTHDGGRVWQRINAGNANYLLDVACPARMRCITVGDRDGVIEVTTDGGRTWHRRGHLSGDMSPRAVTCPTGTVCHAAVAVQNGAGGGLFLTSNDAGRSWSRTRTIPPKLGLARYTGIACPTAALCYITNSDGTILVTKDGGVTWRTVASNAPTYLSGIACVTPRICHALGAYNSIISTPDGGVTWHSDTQGAIDDLASIDCPTPVLCYALAFDGLFLSTDDSGRSWVATGVPLDAIPEPGLHPSLSCPAQRTCFVAGMNATLLRTEDSGRTWQRLPHSFAHTALHFQGIACTSTSVCYVTGSGCLEAGCASSDTRGVVLDTTNGGESWKTLLSTSAREQGVPFDFILQAVTCPTVARCIVVGSPGIILVTEDAGRTWQRVTSPASGTNADIRGVTCATEQACWAVGWGCAGQSYCRITGFISTLLATRDGGRTWKQQESHRMIRLEGTLCGSGVCTAGAALDAIACINESECRAVGQDGTVLLTQDGGATWLSEPTPTSNFLSSIACPAKDMCFTAGDGGAILALKRAVASQRLLHGPSSAVHLPSESIAVVPVHDGKDRQKMVEATSGLDPVGWTP